MITSITGRLLPIVAAGLVAAGAAASGSAPQAALACTPAETARTAGALAAFKQRMADNRRAYFRRHPKAKDRRAFVARQQARLRTLQRAAAVCAPPPLPPPSAPPQLLPFFPQAGIIGQDLYVTNFVDLDPSAGVLDFACGRPSYDGHSGHDSVIRSFREQAIGVPVFAALDGRVSEVQNYFPDTSTAGNTQPFDNHIVLDHGASQKTVYGHLKLGSIRVRVGDRVAAGTQIGLTASSGNSTGPHLHFTLRYRGEPQEPFAGPCRAGASGWVSQAAVRSDAYVSDFTFSPAPFVGRADLPWDEAVRTGAYAAGVRDVYFRVELVNAAGEARVQFVRPDGSVALEDDPPLPGSAQGRTVARGRYRLDLDRTGRWRLRYTVGGRILVDAPFDVVTAPAEIRNRPPNPISIAMSPAAPSPADVIFCRVDTSLVHEDPDYDIARYRYRWTVDGTVVREVTSAALTDAIARGTAPSGREVTCTVTPSDGRLDGPTASSTVRVG
jgi:hypothetical protein